MWGPFFHVSLTLEHVEAAHREAWAHRDSMGNAEGDSTPARCADLAWPGPAGDLLKCLVGPFTGIAPASVLGLPHQDSSDSLVSVQKKMAGSAGGRGEVVKGRPGNGSPSVPPKESETVLGAELVKAKGLLGKLLKRLAHPPRRRNVGIQGHGEVDQKGDAPCSPGSVPEHMLLDTFSRGTGARVLCYAGPHQVALRSETVSFIKGSGVEGRVLASRCADIRGTWVLLGIRPFVVG